MKNIIKNFLNIFKKNKYNNKNICISSNYEFVDKIIDIKKYHYLIQEITNESKIDKSKNIYYSDYNSEKGEVYIFKGKKLIESFLIKNECINFYKKGKIIEGECKINGSFVFEKKGIILDIKVIILQFSIKNTKYRSKNKEISEYINGQILIREK